MKKIYKPILTSIVLTLCIVTPALAIGSDNGNGGSSNGDNGQSVICSRIDNLKSTGNSNVSAKINSMQAKFTQQSAQIASKQSEVNQNLATTRLKASEQFEAKITEMKNQDSLTEEQITAINEFADNMRQAKSEQETAIDSANNTYQVALKAMVQNKQTNMNQYAEEYQAAISNAFQVASANCGTDSNVMNSLRSSIKTARQALLSRGTENSNNMSGEIQQLRLTRNEAIKVANSTFSSLAQSYAQELADILN